MIAASIRAALVVTPWFLADWSPCVVLDAELRITAANDACAAAVARPVESLHDQPLFDLFPDNPADPAADGATRLMRSLEQAMRTGRPAWLGFQRYDVADPSDHTSFVPRYWTIVSSPLRENGRVIGVVNHCQELTVAPLPPVTEPLDEALDGATDHLVRAFPHVSEHDLVSVLTHSHRVVLDTTGAPDIARALELARLRLEVRTGRPARPVGDGFR